MTIPGVTGIEFDKGFSLKLTGSLNQITGDDLYQEKKLYHNYICINVSINHPT